MLSSILSTAFLLLLSSSSIQAFTPSLYPTTTLTPPTPTLTTLKMSEEAETPPSPLQLNPSETALVLIEYQNEFTSEGGGLYEAVKECMEATGTIENSRKVMDYARGAGCTIIHVPIAFDEGHQEIAQQPYGILAPIKENKLFTSGEWASQICDAMKPAPSDIICKGKAGLCGFASSNLDFLLRQNQIKNVVLGGFLTNCCVESTMRTAYELGYQVYTMKDCCAATSVAGQEAAYEHTFGMFSVPTTSGEIIAAVTEPAVAN